jgi:uncharacterized protein YcfL
MRVVLLITLLLVGCQSPQVINVPVPVSCNPPELGPAPTDTRLLIPKDKPAEIIRAGAVDLQAWRADALACRAVVQGLRN